MDRLKKLLTVHTVYFDGFVFEIKIKEILKLLQWETFLSNQVQKNEDSALV